MRADFRLGDWIVRPQRRLIEREGESVHVKPKSMFVFECLVAAGGEPVSRNELFEKVWPGGEVSDDTLSQCIVELRKAFGDNPRQARVIETIPKLGFRLLLTAEPLVEKPTASGPHTPESRAPRDRRWPRPRSVVSVVVVAVIILGILLSVRGSRLWLAEAGATLYLEAAAILAPPGQEQHPGIAVLPFVNMSSDVENDYFSDGISEEILNALAKANRLPVIARTSSFRFKGQDRDVKEIGRLLGVTHVLEGSVRKADDTVRVTAQLIDTTTGAHVWSQAYQRELSGVFTLQNEIAKTIVDQIGIALADVVEGMPDIRPTTEFVTVRRTANPEAYDQYLRGVQLVTSNRPALREQALVFFDRAVALDPDYADAWAAKGRALHMLGRAGFGHPHLPASVYPGAIAAFRRALEIEPGHAFATGWLGVALMYNDYQWAEGMGLIQQSLAINPNDAALLAVASMYMRRMDMEGADEVLERAYRLDPFGIHPVVLRAWQLPNLEALALLQSKLDEDREGYAANYFSVLFNLFSGRLDAAEAHLRRARRVAHPVDLSLDALEWVIAEQRGETTMPVEELWQRAQTERLSYLLWYDFEDSETMVAAYKLAIEQRHQEIHGAFFGDKPSLMPSSEWERIQEVTGVARYRSRQ